jgi:hypothetical protein
MHEVCLHEGSTEGKIWPYDLYDESINKYVDHFGRNPIGHVTWSYYLIYLDRAGMQHRCKAGLVAFHPVALRVLDFHVRRALLKQ